MIFFLLIGTLPVLSAPRDCQRWEVVDLKFESESASKRPTAINFWARFSGPGEQSLMIPGFYNNKTEWIIRFAPPTPGQWTYETQSRDADLAGLKGELTVTANSNPKQHGPVTMYPDNPQHFYYADGTPYFLLAFECDWLFALDAENPDDIPKTRQLVDAIAANGFNQIVMNVYAYDVSWGKDKNLKTEHEYGSPKVFPFGGSNETPNFREFNGEYFKRFDRVIRYLNEKGIIAHLMIYVWNKNVTWPAMYSRMDDYYFDYVTARYQAFPNLVWDISKEALTYGRCDDVYIHDRIKRLRKRDGHNRLVTVHDYGYCSRFPDRVDFISIQTWRNDLNSQMRQVRDRHSNQPIFNIEHGGYEQSPYEVFMGDYVDPVICLERNYDCIFAGTYSTYYWQATSWNVLIPEAMELPESERPRFEYYHNIRKLFDQYDYTALKPTQEYASSGLCLTDNDSILLFLIRRDNYAIHVHLPDQFPEEMNVTWFNPLTGEFLKKGRQKVAGWQEFRSPWEGQFAIVVLEKS